MRQRSRAGALKVSKPDIHKWGLRAYLYHQLNLGENLASPCGGPEQVVQETLRIKAYEIGLIAATKAEADRLVELVEGAMHKHLPNPTMHRLTAYGLDQAWRPQQLFDEVHWLQDSHACPPPQELLASLGSIVHIHLFTHSDTKLRPRSHIYHWRAVGDLADFLASIYLSQELGWFLELDWKSYYKWQPRMDCIATVSSCWGSTPRAAADALQASAEAKDASRSDSGILIIEGGIGTNIGDYVDIVSRLERSLEVDFVTTGWVSLNYSGYGLKLVRFHHP